MFVVTQDFFIGTVVEYVKGFDALLDSTNVFSKSRNAAPTGHTLKTFLEGNKDGLCKAFARAICEIASKSIDLFVFDAQGHNGEH